MSEFIIVSAATPDYAKLASIFVPSWIRNSGAKEIHICPLPDPAKHSRQYCQAQRNEVVRTAILSAKDRGLRAAMLDIDCWVVRPLDEAFDGVHPLGVARWPKINCGVSFYDTLLDFDFEGFLDAVVDRVNAALKAYKEGQRVGLVEQACWHREFHAVEKQVRKLRDNVWNLCVGDSLWEQELRRHKDVVRIAHVKGRGDPAYQKWRIKTAYEILGERIHPDA